MIANLHFLLSLLLLYLLMGRQLQMVCASVAGNWSVTIIRCVVVVRDARLKGANYMGSLPTITEPNLANVKFHSSVICECWGLL